MSGTKDNHQTWLERVEESITGLKYGYVQIMVHDGKIVQIDRLERRRYDGNGEIYVNSKK